MILTGSSCTYSYSRILFNDFRMNDLSKTLFNSWLICSRSFYQPLISSMSFSISISKISECSDFSETVSWHSLYLFYVDQNLLWMQWEGFWVLLACSVLAVSILDLNYISILSFLFHDQITLLISDYWISDLTVLSWAKFDHL